MGRVLRGLMTVFEFSIHSFILLFKFFLGICYSTPSSLPWFTGLFTSYFSGLGNAVFYLLQHLLISFSFLIHKLLPSFPLIFGYHLNFIPIYHWLDRAIISLFWWESIVPVSILRILGLFLKKLFYFLVELFGFGESFTFAFGFFCFCLVFWVFLFFIGLCFRLLLLL